MGFPTQDNIPSLADAARDYGGISLEDDRIVVVHLLLYGPRMKAPTVAEARAWAEHYGYADRDGHVVLVALPEMLGPASFAMVPGIQVVDPGFTLRLDGAGRTAEHDLWREVWPSVGEIVEGE